MAGDGVCTWRRCLQAAVIPTGLGWGESDAVCRHHAEVLRARLSVDLAGGAPKSDRPAVDTHRRTETWQKWELGFTSAFAVEVSTNGSGYVTLSYGVLETILAREGWRRA